jgi:hypothetical protein
LLAVYARNAHAKHIQIAVPKPKEGAGDEDVAPLAGAPNPLPKTDAGFAASPAGLLRLLPNRLDVDALDVAPPPPNSPPGLLAGVFEAPPPKMLDVPVVAPPPNRPEPAGVLVPVLPVLAVPKREGAVPADVLLAAPNNGLFGVLLLLCCPN